MRRCGCNEFIQASDVTPEIDRGKRGRDRSIAALRQLHVLAGIAHHRLMEAWIAVLGHHLVDATTQHQITTEQQPQGCRCHRCCTAAAAKINKPAPINRAVSLPACDTGITTATFPNSTASSVGTFERQIV